MESAGFCEKNHLTCPQGPRKYVLRPASPGKEAGQFYSLLDLEQDAAVGTFGGGRFHHSWWPHNDDQFNTPVFKEALQEFVDELRARGPLKSESAMSGLRGLLERLPIYAVILQNIVIIFRAMPSDTYLACVTPARKPLQTKGKPRNISSFEVFRFGSGRRIRTLTYGVRVRCATLTQSRYIPDERFYYIHFQQFVKYFFHRFKNFST